MVRAKVFGPKTARQARPEKVIYPSGGWKNGNVTTNLAFKCYLHV
jgi:hypothetical protein